MTIVYCTTTVYSAGGMEKVLIQKANYLADYCGCTVYIVTFHQKGRPTFFPLSDSVRLVDLGVNIRIPVTRPLYRRKLEKFLKEVKADICISLSGVELGSVARVRCDCPKIAEFHFSYLSFFIRGKQRRLPRFIRSVRKMDRFVVLTKEDETQWKKYLGNVVQIYNPADIGSAKELPCEANGEAAEASGRPFRCISGGRLVEQKNYGAMLRLWSKVSGDFPEWRLDIYGKGPLQGSLEALARELGIESSVRFNPPVGNFREELEKSSIYLMTSRYEGFPMTLIEAASEGVPAIAFSCPTGPAEAIVNGETGFVLPEGDIDAMAARLHLLMKDGSLRERMGKNARENCKIFSIDKIMGKWMTMFKELSVKEKVLVILHIYYEQFADYYLDKLQNINGCEWDLVVTGNALSEDLRKKILAVKSDATFIETSNLGYDIWPFICAVKQTDLSKYSFVIKLHTKNQDSKVNRINGIRLTGEEWGRELTEVLLGSPERFTALKEIFRTRKDVGLVYSMSLDRTLGFKDSEDTELLSQEMERLGIKPGPKRFCAGTMFAVRASALGWLQDEKISEDIFQTTGASHGRGTMAHAYERLLCIAVNGQGYSTVLVKNSLKRLIYLKIKKALQPALEWLFSVNYRKQAHCKVLRICGIDFKIKTE